jgi:hypothetical protein
MPTGLPSLNIPDVSSLISSLRSNAQYAIEYLEIPNYSLVKEQFQIAIQDAEASARSTANFLQTTSRPFVILLSLLSRYIFILLKIIAEHTIYHAILAAKEVWRQLQFATSWLIAYQKSLPKTAIYMEIGFIFLLIGLYAIRKYIKRKRYVERVTRWYRGKRSALIMKYNRFIDRVAQTSIVFALLLPHVVYMFIMASMKWFLPSVVRYFACKTLLADLISIYIPFVKTIMVIHKWRTFGFKTDEKSGESKDNVDDNGEHTSSSNTGGFMSIFRRRRVGSEYKNAIGREVKGTEKKKSHITRTRLSEDQKQVVEEASKLMQYWVVNSLIYSAVQTYMLMPFLGRVLTNVNIKSKPVSSLPWKQKKSLWLNRIDIKPSAEFFEECKLLFFIWLRMLPTSLTGSNKRDLGKSQDGKSSANSNNVKKRVAAFENTKTKARKDNKIPFSNLPVDIIYERLSPMVIALLSSSSRLLQHGSTVSTNGPQTLLMRAVALCRSFLDAMVWTKMISANTKDRIITILVECSDLLPASVTLFMPAYFTSYGIVFVSLLVPSGKSAIAYNSLKGTKTNTETVKIMESTLRYLQYWVVQSIISWILSAFSPILAWVPLSTHMALLVWAYAQLEGTTISLYNILEWDLVAFGLLNANPHQENAENMNVEDSVTMKVFNSIAKHVPSSLPSQDSIASCDDEKDGKKGAKNTTDVVDSSKIDVHEPLLEGHDKEEDQKVQSVTKNTNENGKGENE